MINKQTVRYVLTVDQAEAGPMQHEPILAQDFMNMVITLIGSDTAAFTVKVKGSTESPDAIPTDWSYLETKNDESQEFIAGNTGYTFSGDGEVKLEVNTSVMTWLAIEISDYSDGTLNASATLTSNQ